MSEANFVETVFDQLFFILPKYEIALIIEL